MTLRISSVIPSMQIVVVFGRMDVVWILYLVVVPQFWKVSLQWSNNSGIASGSLVHHWRSRLYFVLVRYRIPKRVPDMKLPCVKHPTNVRLHAVSPRSVVHVLNGTPDGSYCTMIWRNINCGRGIMMDHNVVPDRVPMHPSRSNRVPTENKIVPMHSYVWKCTYSINLCLRWFGNERLFVCLFATRNDRLVLSSILVLQSPPTDTLIHCVRSLTRFYILQMLLGRIVFRMLCLWCIQTLPTWRTRSIIGPHRTTTTQVHPLLFTNHAYVYAVGMLFLCDIMFGQSVCYR